MALQPSTWIQDQVNTSTARTLGSEVVPQGGGGGVDATVELVELGADVLTLCRGFSRVFSRQRVLPPAPHTLTASPEQAAAFLAIALKPIYNT